MTLTPDHILWSGLHSLWPCTPFQHSLRFWWTAILWRAEIVHDLVNGWWLICPLPQHTVIGSACLPSVTPSVPCLMSTHWPYFGVQILGWAVRSPQKDRRILRPFLIPCLIFESLVNRPLLWGSTDVSVVRSMYCSWRRLEFDSQDQVGWVPIALGPGNPAYSSGLREHLLSPVHTLTLTHTKLKINLYKTKIWKL